MASTSEYIQENQDYIAYIDLHGKETENNHDYIAYIMTSEHTRKHAKWNTTVQQR